MYPFSGYHVCLLMNNVHAATISTVLMLRPILPICMYNGVFQPEVREMDEKSLEEELQALALDKAGETEYVQSLQLQIMKLKVSRITYSLYAVS